MSDVVWRCYCPISPCRLLDPYGFRHALAHIRRTYGDAERIGD